jgi:hypothetical protein
MQRDRLWNYLRLPQLYRLLDIGMMSFISAS